MFETVLIKTHFGKAWSLHLTVILLLCGLFGLLLRQETWPGSPHGVLVVRGERAGFHSVRWSCRRNNPPPDKHNSGFASSVSGLILACGAFLDGDVPRSTAEISGTKRRGINNDGALFSNEHYQRSHTGFDRLAQFLANYRKTFSI
jgi:hypothetical protein